MEPSLNGQSRRPAVDVMDDTFVVADVSALARTLADPRLWREWWPGLELTVTEDRGRRGVRWSVGGELTGTAEIWLEPWRDGVLVHWFLRGEPAGHGRRRNPDKIRRAYVTSFKRNIHALKDQLERGRPAGTPGGSTAARGVANRTQRLAG